MKKLIIAAAAAALLLPACKPTEKNYKAAYDAAVAKREKAMAETMAPAGELISEDGPQRRVVNGDTIFVATERVRPEAKDVRLPEYNVAVTKYRMGTNARAGAEDLRAAGYAGAMAVYSAEDSWYTIAGGFPTLDEAVAFSRRFRSDNPRHRYIGLPASPVIVRAY